MLLGIPKELFPGECRVATTPDVIPHLIKLGFDVSVETGAGLAAKFSDAAFAAAGANIVENADELWS